MVMRMQGRPEKEAMVQLLIREANRNTAVTWDEIKDSQITSYDIPDLVLYLGVSKVSLGEVGELSGGWSIVPWLSRKILVKNFL